MRSILSMCLLLFMGFTQAQTNVYDCFVDPVVTQGDIDATNNYSSPCIVFEEAQQYNFGQNDNNTVTGVKGIDIEPGFNSEDYNQGAGMTLVLCNDLRDVVSFSHTDLNQVEALKKFEFGIELPTTIEQRIQQFIATGDTSAGGGINPYLEWQLDATAIFEHRSSGFTKEVYGFYFQEYERETNSDPNLWTWNQLPTDYHTRFRYAPEQEGVWDISVSVILKDGSVYTYCPFSINVTPNTEDDGYVKVANNNHVLERNGELFFPIGQNGPWPREEGPGTGIWAGAYGDKPVGSFTHKEFELKMEQYQNKGLKYFRLLLNPACLDIEFEEVGNYTDRLNFGWEIDQIVEKAEELDLYIHFNMLVHYAFENKSSGIRYNWDWGDEYIPYKYPNSEGSYAYKNRFGLSNDAPQDWLTDPGCKKYYKQKIRYLISRYGYSPHVALFELLSEISNVAKTFNDVYSVPNPGPSDEPMMNDSLNPYQDDPAHRLKVADWHDEMAKYIKNELKHTEHLLTVSYGPPLKAPDYSYAIPEIDVVTVNRYSNLIGEKYQAYVPQVNDLHQTYNKPVLFSETGPLEETSCDNGVTYRKEAWTTAFCGVAGYNMWDGQDLPDWWENLVTVRNFIENTPDVANLLNGDWEAFYTNDVDGVQAALQKEVTYISGQYTNDLGNAENWVVGAVSNLTDNYFTNANPNETNWCTTQNISAELTEKENLYLGQPSPIYLYNFWPTDYVFNWYDANGNWLLTNNTWLSFLTLLIHPESCVAGNCSTNYDTPEIPFIANWEFSDLTKSAEDIGEKKIETLGRHDIPGHQLSIFPNPTSNYLTIMCTDPTVVGFQVVDGTGKVIEVIECSNLEKVLPVTNYDSGIFVILGITEQGAIKCQQRWVKL